MQKKSYLVVMATVAMLSLTACGSCDHTFSNATCTTPKTCTLCGATEGEVAEHTWVEATYSAPKTCSVCGATEGEKLEAFFSSRFDNYLAELDKPYDLELVCYDDPSRITVGKVIFSNYKKYTADARPALPGYEWRSVDCNLLVGDANGCEFGFDKFNFGIVDYYIMCLTDEQVESDVEGTIGAYKSPIDGQTIYLGEGNYKDKGWLGKANEEYGFLDTYSICETINMMVPVDYDGVVAEIEGSNYSYDDLVSDKSPEETVKNKMVPFRFDMSAVESSEPAATANSILASKIPADVKTAIEKKSYMDSFDGNMGDMSFYYDECSDDVESVYAVVKQALEDAGCTNIEANQYMEVAVKEEGAYMRDYMFTSPNNEKLNCNIQIAMNGVEAFDGDFAGTHISFPAYHTCVSIKYFKYNN